MIPRPFGQYRLVDLLGTGGMGEVYRAEDTRRDREVALKLLPEIFSGDDEYTRRFRRESHVAARLREPHVIPIHDYGEIDGRLFIDMRLVDGVDISRLLADDGALTAARAVHLIGQIAEALDAAHADGLVHRDIKPSNVLVTRNDFVYVVDFGIARSIGTARTSLTMTGATVGTLDYMAPERFTNQPVDCRADVYSLACLLFECLTATPPFDGDDLPSLMYAHLYTDAAAPSASNRTVPPALDAVVARGMAKRPEDRFPSAGELAAAARAALADTPAPTLRGEATSAVPVGSAVAVPGAAPQGPPDRGRRAVPAVGALGLASADGRHRSVDQLPGPPPGGRVVLAPTGAPPPRSRLLVAMAALVVVSLIALIVTVVVTVVPAGSGTADAGDAAGDVAEDVTVTRPEAVEEPPDTVAASIAFPTAQGVYDAGPTPGYLHVAPNGRYAYICNRNAGYVSVFDTTLNTITGRIPTPAGPPQFVSFSPDGSEAYVSIFNEDFTENFVSIVDTATARITATVAVGKRPFASSTNLDGSLLFVPSHDDGRVDVIDLAAPALVDMIPVAKNPHWVAFGRDGRYLYTANHESGVVTVVDAATRAVVEEIPVGQAPHSTAVSPDGNRVAVVNFVSNEVSVIDTATNDVVATVAVGLSPQDIAYSPDGRYLYTADVNSDRVSVIDTATNTVTAPIPVGDGPTSVSVSPDGRHAYVTLLNEGKVLVLDTAAVS